MRVLVVFGGRSGEHEVSVESARTVVSALDSLRHQVLTVGITRSGRWTLAHPSDADRVSETGPPFDMPLDPTVDKPFDVVFPVLHGPHGEDGSLQGLFELAGVAYVGAGIEGSAIGMNKVTHKRLFAEAGLPVVDFVAFSRAEWETSAPDLAEDICKLGFPCFCKPVHLGSSVGISKVKSAEEIGGAVERALRHDDDVIVEASGFPRELEVGMLGPLLSVVGEVVPEGEFYDYRAKYRGEWTELKIPADIPLPVEDAIGRMATRAYQAARCDGLARVDFFFDPATEALQVNEINTVPGLTPSSMFPRLWEASGKPFTEVVGVLLDDAVERHGARLALERARAAAHDEEVGS